MTYAMDCTRARPCLLLGLLASLALPVGAHQDGTSIHRHPDRPFPLAIPPGAKRDPGVRHPLVDHHGRVVRPDRRTRIVEHAVARSGGWERWRVLDRLFLRLRRRVLNRFGRVEANTEEHLVYTRDGLTRYWEEDGALHMARLQDRTLTVVEPPLPRGSPEATALAASLEKEAFWLAHPFLLYREGIRTRFAGTRPTRGTLGRVLVATFSPGAAPYRRVDYLFDPVLGDLLEAIARPERDDQPREEYHFSGRIESRNGLRLPRRREKLVDGIVREVVVLHDVSSDPVRLPRSRLHIRPPYAPPAP